MFVEDIEKSVMASCGSEIDSKMEKMDAAVEAVEVPSPLSGLEGFDKAAEMQNPVQTQPKEALPSAKKVLFPSKFQLAPDLSNGQVSLVHNEIIVESWTFLNQLQ